MLVKIAIAAIAVLLLSVELGRASVIYLGSVSRPVELHPALHPLSNSETRLAQGAPDSSHPDTDKPPAGAAARGRDYYAPGPATVVHASPGQLKLNEQGDYYVGDKVILNKRRIEALKKCTHNIAFESDRYVACMSRQGEAP